MISVCVATHNGEKYITAQLESILSQLAPGDEVVVSDDGSTDSTLSAIRRLGDPRIRIVEMRHPRRYSHPMEYAAHNFENALANCRGDLIFLSDQDDIWLPGKVEAMTKALETNTMVVSDCKVTDGTLNVVNESYFSLVAPRKGALANIIKCSYLGSCMAFQKKMLNFVLPLPKRYVAHDLWIALLAEKTGDTAFLRRPMMLYRRHGLTTSSAAGKSGNSLWFKIASRACMAVRLFIRLQKTKQKRAEIRQSEPARHMR